MKLKSTLTLLLFAISLNSILAQMSWHKLRDSEGRAEDITFWGADNALVCSGRGEIYKTADGGQTWQTVFSNDSFYLRSIEYIDAQTVFCGSLDSTLFMSNDGGNTWSNILNRVPQTPYGICGMDARDGVIHMVGNFFSNAYYMSSHDGGTTFSYSSLNNIAHRLIDVYFTSPDTGFAIGSYNADTTSILGRSIILRTIDGGINWSQHYLSQDSSLLAYGWKIFPLDNKLYVSYESFSGLFYAYSNDRGNTWTEKKVKGLGVRLQGIGFINDTLGFFGLHTIGNAGPIFLHYNTNLDTAIAEFGTNGTINRFHRLSENLMYATGEDIWAYYDSTLTFLGHRSLPKTSINEGLTMEIFPNPLTDGDLTVNIDYPDKMRSSIELYNEAGQKVKTLYRGYVNAGTLEFKVKMSIYPAGVYYVVQNSFYGPSKAKFVYSK